MIPKILHLCWISGSSYPPLIDKCIASWRKILPDYEIMLWDKERVLNIGSVWCNEAIDAGKYAFVADYVRLYAIYHYGGVYLDSDVECLKTIDGLLHLPYFVCLESPTRIEFGVIGSEPGCQWIKYCLSYYQHRHFVNPVGFYRMEAMPFTMERRLSKRYSLQEVDIRGTYTEAKKIIYHFPIAFCAHPNLFNQKATSDTFFIHYFAGTWVNTVREVEKRNFCQRVLFKLYLPARWIKHKLKKK